MADLDWEHLAKGVLHPLQTRILERAAAAPAGRFSPVELAAEFEEPIGNVSYHISTLFRRGLLKKAGTTPVRGALQHHYQLAAVALR